MIIIYKHLKYKIKPSCYAFRSFPLGILSETDERSAERCELMFDVERSLFRLCRLADLLHRNITRDLSSGLKCKQIKSETCVNTSWLVETGVEIIIKVLQCQ